MSYSELIAKALRGRSVNQAAKDWNMQQVTLNNYVRGKRVPGHKLTLLIAKEAGVSLAYAVQAMAEQEDALEKRTITEKFSANFEYLLSLVKPRGVYVSAR